MLNKLKTNLKSSSFFKLRFLIVLLAIVCLVPYSISYAFFSQRLSGTGSIDVIASQSTLVVSSISSPVIHKNGKESKTPTYSNNSATFNVELTNTNSTLTYTIKVVNNGEENVKYDTTNITSSNSAIEYTLIGLDSSTIIAHGEELEFQIVIGYTEDYKYNFPSSKKDTTTLEFVFQPTLRDKLIPLTGSILEDSSEVALTEYGAPATITINNDNDFSVSFKFITQNNFGIYDENGEEKEYSISANSTNTYEVFIKDKDEAVTTGTEPTVYVLVEMSAYNITETALIDSITLILPSIGKFQIVDDYNETSDDVDYSVSSSSSGGIYRKVVGDGITYYYRGVVKNNYFSFAGLTWRILRIDEKANIKLISNDVLKNSRNSAITSSFKSSNSASSQSAAVTLVKLINNPSSTSNNSPIYGYLTDTSTTTLRGWYNNNIAGTDYEKYVVDTVLCMDTEGGNATSSGTSSSVYYFGPYQKIGADTALYEPEFSCPEGYSITEKIGLLNADEYVLAGGAYKTSNTSFFLNDSGISTNWWTMSPAYYDSSQKKVGVFYVSSSGEISDWPNNNTITNAYGIRPVITVSGNYELFGTGTSSDPYHF